MSACNTGCLLQLPGQCVYYSGTTTPYLGIGMNTDLNTLIRVIDGAFSSFVSTIYPEIYLLSQTAAFTQADLNNLYPTTAIGTKVICPNLTYGGLVYWKYTTINWFSLPMAPVP